MEHLNPKPHGVSSHSFIAKDQDSLSSSSSSSCVCVRVISDNIQMQQRTSSSTSHCSGEHRAINVADQPQTEQRKTDGDDRFGLPLYDTRSANGKREVSLSRSVEKWRHAIPLILLLCIFVLWFVSFPVNVTVRDGRTTVIRQIDASLPNTTRIDLTILAVSAAPISSVPQKLSYDNETYLLLVSAPH